MRSISAASLQAIQQSYGLEPVIIVRVWWGKTTYTDYCDRKFQVSGLVGKLIQVSGIEDIVDLNASASSVNMSVTLDDSDSSIKHIFNYNDVHQVYVQVFQWFTIVALSDAFPIFEGVISSPIVWSEGARTLKFDIVTQLEDREVGFSVDEAAFNAVASNLIGKAWPVVFGTVKGLQPLKLNETPSMVLASGFGLIDEDQYTDELQKINDAILELNNKAREAWELGLSSALTASHFKGGHFFPDDPAQADQYDTAASNYYKQSSDYTAERIKQQEQYALKVIEFEFQKSLNFDRIGLVPVVQTHLPVGTYAFTGQVNNYNIVANYVNGGILIQSVTEVPDVNDKTGTNEYELDTTTKKYKRVYQRQKFVWFDGGSTVNIISYQRYFILSLGNVNVINVWGRNKWGRAVVPPQYYAVEHINLNGLIYTRLVFPTPLESLPGEWQASDLEVDCQSVASNHPCDIMAWAINNYSSFSIDEASWSVARPRLNNTPMNFVLTERMNTMQFLKEVAYQARCAIWLNDRKFFLRFLPDELSPVETITDSDVENGSVEITSTETERLITKYVATWKENINQKEDYKVILRYNILKYGTKETTYSFFCFNTYEAVAKAAEFWMIRSSNTWKIISFKTMLHKLRIEAFDPVQLTFSENLVALGAVTGLVTKSVFNPDDDTLSIEVWLPIRFGEMVPYKYAFPGTIQVIYPDVSDPNIHTGQPVFTGELLPLLSIPPSYAITFSHGGKPHTWGTGTTSADTVGGPTIVQLDPNEIKTVRPIGLTAFNDKNRIDINGISPFSYTTPVPNTFYGVVASKKNDTTYVVDVYTRGFKNDPTTMDVSIGIIKEGSILPKGFPLEVHRTTFKEGNLITAEYWAQPAVWVPPVEDDNT